MRSHLAVFCAVYFGMMIGLSAYAGQHVGNGGDAHVCRDKDTGAIVFAELYDFLEIRHVAEGVFLDLGGQELSYQEKILYVLDRLNRVDPERAFRLKARYSEAFADPNRREYKFVPRPLPDVPDHGDTGIVFDEGCGVEQAAIRLVELVGEPYEKRFQINQPIFDAFDNDNRAGLILHELLYEDAIFRGFKNSRRVRFFTAFLSSALMNSYEADAFRSLVERNLFFGDQQLVLDRGQETFVIEYISTSNSFTEASEFCESNRHGGRLLDGYNEDFLVREFRHSPLLNLLSNGQWWGELENNSAGQLSTFSITRDRNRFYRSEVSSSTKLSFICIYSPPNDGIEGMLLPCKRGILCKP